MSDAEFKPVMKCNVKRVGERALLVAGYGAEEAAKLDELLVKIEAPDVRVIRMTDPMLAMTLDDALTLDHTEEPLPPDKLPRVLLMSGLTGSEFHDLLNNYNSTGIPRPIFASATEHNLKFTVRDLLVELLNEMRAMQKMRAEQKTTES